MAATEAGSTQASAAELYAFLKRVSLDYVALVCCLQAQQTCKLLCLRQSEDHCAKHSCDARMQMQRRPQYEPICVNMTGRQQ